MLSSNAIRCLHIPELYISAILRMQLMGYLNSCKLFIQEFRRRHR